VDNLKQNLEVVKKYVSQRRDVADGKMLSEMTPGPCNPDGCAAGGDLR